MKIENIMLEPLANFLMSFELKGKDSRIRTKFVKLLTEKITQLQDDGFALIKDYAELDEDGEPKQVENDGKLFYDIPRENRKTYNDEYTALMKENSIIDETESNRELILVIKELVLNCELTFKGKEAIEYDFYCEIFENVE